MENVGGQAVIEGVMMKGYKAWTVAVRKPDGNIVVKSEHLKDEPAFFKTPLVCGVVKLLQSLTLGIKALSYSADISQGGDGTKSSPISRAFSLLVSFVLAFSLFFLLPLYLTRLIGYFSPSVQANSLVFNLIDGAIRIAFFLIYIFAISMLKDIKRVFQYHGAEHMVIHAFEAGKPLTPDNARAFSTIHPRCGTSFLLIVMTISIFMFSLIPNTWSLVEQFVTRLILLPVIAGVSYEFLKYTFKNMNHSIVKLIAMPGLMLQKITTSSPSDDQIEVAIMALQSALEKEGYCAF
jgi:uncharacterized protein YqhQ